MKIHHLNCGTCCPAGGRLFDGTTDRLRGHMVCHCLLIESADGLVLVDTGFGTRDIANPHRIAGPSRRLLNPQLRPAETALAQVRALGFLAEDVRHILVTHLDFDHAGGLEDFPTATVHVTAREKEAAEARGGFIAADRYRPKQWDDVEQWRLYSLGGGEPWYGFDCVRGLDGLPADILLIPLAGHTWGHSGVAVHEGGGRWLLHCGDAYLYRGEVGSERPTCPPGLRGLQRLTEVDRAARRANQAKLRRLSLDHADDVRLFCAHDPVEWEILAGQG